ncbi:hypothetical protein L963_1540 [Leuconostoc mesenteroides subsp. cremoris T26]|nr:hypothetical protein L963_1540 [Leuconostoc mesenteroides subsp. cremoris T26]
MGATVSAPLRPHPGGPGTGGRASAPQRVAQSLRPSKDAGHGRGSHGLADDFLPAQALRSLSQVVRQRSDGGRQPRHGAALPVPPRIHQWRREPHDDALVRRPDDADGRFGFLRLRRGRHGLPELLRAGGHSIAHRRDPGRRAV